MCNCENNNVFSFRFHLTREREKRRRNERERNGGRAERGGGDEIYEKGTVSTRERACKIARLAVFDASVKCSAYNGTKADMKSTSNKSSG